MIMAMVPSLALEAERKSNTACQMAAIRTLSLVKAVTMSAASIGPKAVR